MSRLIYIGFFSFFLSLAFTWLIIHFSGKKGLFLPPKSERWHKKPTPTFGGIAVFTAFTASTIIFSQNLSEIAPVLGGGAIIFLIGIYDDLFDLRPYTKLLLEIGVACAMIMSGIHVIYNLNPILFIPLTIFWIVGVTNAFNLLDNMDGLSPGIGVIASFFLLALSFKLGRTDLYVPLTILGSALLAFLIFNFNPAKIFLGDCGALFIGFTLAALSIKGTWHQASNLFLMLFTPLLILGIPIFDTFFVSFQRKMHGLPIMHGGKDHSSHRLVMLGWSERKTAIFLYVTSLLLGMIALIGLEQDNYFKSVIFAITFITVLLFGIFLAQAKVYGDKKSDSRPNGKAKVIGNILYKRRMLDVLIDTTIIIVAYVSAYLIKYDGAISDINRGLINQSLPIILFIKLLSLYAAGLYRGIWKYIDFEDSIKILKGALLGSMVSIIIIVGLARFEGYSRALFFIDFIVFIFLLAGTRIMLRIFRESFFSYPKMGKRILVVGAGEAGKMVLIEIKKNRAMGLNPVGIIDDDETKHGKRLLGVPVLGSISQIPKIVADNSIERIIITIPSASDAEKALVVKKCEEAQVEYKIMKSFEELLY